jgi:hypothetical protein
MMDAQAASKVSDLRLSQDLMNEDLSLLGHYTLTIGE